MEIIHFKKKSYNLREKLLGRSWKAFNGILRIKIGKGKGTLGFQGLYSLFYPYFLWLFIFFRKLILQFTTLD